MAEVNARNMLMKIIGMDLGTSNTYIYMANEDVNPASLPEPLVIPKISDDNGSIATVVMYEDEKPFLAGNIAESEFYSNLEARPKRRLASQFKPEISQRQAGAMAAMTDFLKLIRAALPEGTLESDVRLYVGMPSLSREDFSINMGDCFKAAGWPAPLFVRESDAALVSCLQSGVLDINDIENRCLILDFGGGTFDFTCVESTETLQNGGDLLYGGRLFDDLIYQVFCREDKDFSKGVPHSPYAWYVHWIECKNQKEDFSNAVGGREEEKPVSLHAPWFDQAGMRHDSFVRDYTREKFIGDAENYSATPEMLEVLSEYMSRGGLGQEARDLLEKRKIGLIFWLRTILEKVSGRRSVSKVILTGGSSRWFFVRDVAAELFPAAQCLHSVRGFEDIAFGLALFPILAQSHAKVQRLLQDRLELFTIRAVKKAQAIVEKNSDSIVNLCANRIVEYDVMPVLEEAHSKSMTASELESQFSENIKNDAELMDIVKRKSENLRTEIQKELNFEFRQWLRENGILLVPAFTFPGQAIGQDFFKNVSVKITRLDSLNLMQFTLTTVIPVLAATATAGAIAHTGEPVSAILGGGAAYGATWLLARAAPSFIENRKLPAFFLNDSNRKKIIENNRGYIEKSLSQALSEVRASMSEDIESRIKSSLTAMLGKITVLNQVRVAAGSQRHNFVS